MASVEHEARAQSLFKAIREDRAWSLEEMAQRLHTTVERVRQWETAIDIQEVPPTALRFLENVAPDLSPAEIDRLVEKTTYYGGSLSLLDPSDVAMYRLRAALGRARQEEENPETREALVFAEEAAEFYARVMVPARHMLDVQLVPLQGLQELERHRGDKANWIAFVMLIVGGLISMGVNLATGGTLSANGVWFLFGGAVLALTAAWQAYQFHQRAEDAQKLLDKFAEASVPLGPGGRRRNEDPESPA